MSRLILAAVLMIGLVIGLGMPATGAQAAEVDFMHCKYPTPPVVPDGRAATQDEMAEAGSKIREFVAGVERSIECLDRVEADLGDAATSSQREQFAAIRNNGIDQMHTVAGAYNTQVRVFNSADSDAFRDDVPDTATPDQMEDLDRKGDGYH